MLFLYYLALLIHLLHQAQAHADALARLSAQLADLTAQMDELRQQAELTAEPPATARQNGVYHPPEG